MQVPPANTCGTPPKLPEPRWAMVKQWPFDMVGSSSVSSALVFHPQGNFCVDLMPFFKRLADLLSDRGAKTDMRDFWVDFERHIEIKDLHHPNMRNVYKALNDHWRLISGSPLPHFGGFVEINAHIPHPSDSQVTTDTTTTTESDQPADESLAAPVRVAAPKAKRGAAKAKSGAAQAKKRTRQHPENSQV